MKSIRSKITSFTMQEKKSDQVCLYLKPTLVPCHTMAPSILFCSDHFSGRNTSLSLTRGVYSVFYYRCSCLRQCFHCSGLLGHRL